MKILYAIQGTGNGHISRARDIIPVLKQYGELDILISGVQVDVALDEEIKYKLSGLSFIFGRKGGIDFWRTLKNIKFIKLWKEIWDLNVSQYDLVLNDFEPISAWACRLKGKRCIGLSHQSAVIHPLAPKPSRWSLIGFLVLKYYAPVSTSYGFHFRPYAKNIFYPIIRKEIRHLSPIQTNHFTVYLPSYSDKHLLKMLSKINAEFHVFSKHCSKEQRNGNVYIQPIDNLQFIESMRTCNGVICGAGFESPAEAMFLGKKLLVVPMLGQYEQHCNAASLEKLGVKVIRKFSDQNLPIIENFINAPDAVAYNFPDQLQSIIQKVMEDQLPKPQLVTSVELSGAC